MMKDANYLFDNGYMSLHALADRIISRSPSEIRIALFNAAGSAKNMFDFSKAAEKVIPLAFGREGSMNAVRFQPMKTYKQKKPADNRKDKFCELHGKLGHSTDECSTLTKLKKLGWEKNTTLSSTNMVESDKNESNDEVNQSFYFSFSSLNNIVNPFSITGMIKDSKIPILIDTGADLSLVSKTLLPNNYCIKKTSQTARAANGGQIPILGFIESLSLKVDQNIICINKILVTSSNLNYLLLGAPEILAHPELITSILENKRKPIPNNQQPVELRVVQLANNRLESQEQEIRKKFSDLFASEISPSKVCSIKKHKIDTGEHQPICQKEHRIPIHLEDKVQIVMDQLKKQQICQSSVSPWRSSLVVVPKEDDKIRLCVDYRALNEITVKNAYSLPRTDSIIDTLAKAEIFSVMDATSGYYQIALDEEDMKKTAFCWKGELLEFTRMPFGLCNAPATFQSIMNTILKDENWKFAIPYLDDIIVFSNSVAEHKNHLEIVLGKLKAAGISLNSNKSKFFKTEVSFLGNIISKGQVKPDPQKIQAIRDCQPPNTLRELRSFLGLANFCSAYVKHYATIAAPLTDLLKGEVKASQKKICWTQESMEAFEKLKSDIAEVTSRAQPDKDKDFILTTDASDKAMGAVLSQIDDEGNERMIACFSKKFVKAQLHYSTTDKEALAVEKGILHFDHYLRGKKFILRTDHQALQYIKTASNHNSRILRLSLNLQKYSYTPIYIKGETNIADILSRPAENEINTVQNTDLTDNQKEEILKSFHDLLGHGSASNMKFAIKNIFDWKGIHADIDMIVKKCTICNKAGESLMNTKNKVIETSYPNELWEVDLIGRIPGKDGQNDFIFIAIDHYTKWMETRKLKNKSSSVILKAIQELIIDKHGIPNRILSDNGLEFKNEQVAKLCEELNFKWDFSSPRHHETVGGVERGNQTFINILKKVTDFGKLSWPGHLEKATQAYNISYHRGINTSPYILKYGRTPKLEIAGKVIESKELSKPELIEMKEEHFKHYQESIKKGTKEVKYNLEIGDYVLIFNPPLSNKLAEKWHSGYRISGKIEPDAYLVVKEGKEFRVNKAHIKKDFSYQASNPGGEVSYIYSL